MKKQPKGQHGGLRNPPGGRPKKPPVTMPPPQIEAGIDWAAVQKFAEAGCSEEDIITGLGISELQLKDAAISERLRQMVTQGNALKKLKLQMWSDTTAQMGGANTIALEMRNRLGWDKQNESTEQPPDLMSAHSRLRLTAERLAKVASEEHGREVTPAEILLADVLLPKKGEPVH